METENNKRIDSILSSLDGMQPAEPNPFLYTRILNKISEKATEYTPMKIVWLAAVSFLLLLLLNVQTLKRNSNSTKNNSNSMEEFASQYQLLNTNTINYN